VSEQHVLLVPICEAAALVEPWLEYSVGGRPSHGIPAHVTLLAPCPADADGIAEVLADEQAFDVEFREVRRFPGVAAYLAPEPAEPFVRLTQALWARFPDWPPYGGRFLPDITPHLTVAWGAKLDEAEAAVAAALPLRGRAREAVLLRQLGPERWQPRARFPLRGA
jgi:2'-5' RNA ligase superfamily